MESRHINTEVSRITNGNMSSAWGGWEGPNFVNFSAINEVSGHEAPSDPANPVYYIKANGVLYNNITYRDLSSFPSVVRFSGTLYPLDYDRFSIYVFTSYWGAWPFRWQSGWDLLDMEPGVAVIVDSADHYGEYRVQEVKSGSVAFVVPTTGSPPVAESGDSAIYKRRINSGFFEVTLASFSPTIGDHFVCKDPLCGGKIYGKSGDTFQVQIYASSNMPPHTYVSTPATKAMGPWKVISPRTISLVRDLPVALYDLTLAYTTEQANPFDANQTTIEILDELDTVQKSITPMAIDGTAKHIDRNLGNGRIRRVQRFFLETRHPVYGRSRVKFGGTPVDVKISNVVLYRGNYVEKVLSGTSEKIDFVESQIDANSEIIPKGTIIAYAGGSACPPGFFLAGGIGALDEHTLGQGHKLRAEVSEHADTLILDVQLDQRTSRNGVTDPRTILYLDRNELQSRVVGTGGTYQHSRRLVNIVPFRYASNHNLYNDLIIMRESFIHDPHPVWITDSYDQTDIRPGCILEVQWQAQQRRMFFVISQYAQGSFVEVFNEQEPQRPFGEGAHDIDDDSAARRRAIRQVNVGGLDRNSVFSYFKMYGTFDPVYEDKAIMELVGDWVAVMNAIKQDHDARIYVWKSGVVSHAQTHPELGDDVPYGGYGYLGEPHSHYMGMGDATILDNLGTDSPTYAAKVPINHEHGYLFGAATIPKVRPILLCQKI